MQSASPKRRLASFFSFLEISAWRLGAGPAEQRQRRLVAATSEVPSSIRQTKWVAARSERGSDRRRALLEAGTPNPSWTEASTNSGTPLCTVAGCGTGTDTGPRTGLWWTWFGGISAFEDGSVSQSVVIPVGSTTLSFWVEAIVCATPADFLEVLVDGNQEFLVNGSSPLCDVLGYSPQSVDISAYADGGAHTINFHSTIFGTNGGGSNFFVDDVELLSATTCPGVPLAPPAPNILEIPTLQTTGLVLFGLVLAFAALLLVRRRGIA